MSLAELENSIGYKFKNKKLLDEAITHKSINSDFNNERLEFLGDSVISLVVSEVLHFGVRVGDLLAKHSCTSPESHTLGGGEGGGEAGRHPCGAESVGRSGQGGEGGGRGGGPERRVRAGRRLTAGGARAVAQGGPGRGGRRGVFWK